MEMLDEIRPQHSRQIGRYELRQNSDEKVVKRVSDSNKVQIERNTTYISLSLGRAPRAEAADTM